MRKEERIGKEMVVNAVIENMLEKKEPEEIKTPFIDKYKSPSGLKIKSTNETFVPDITAKFGESSNLYEVELDDDFQVNKWKLFSIHAKKKNGNLYLIVPDWLRESVKKELTDQNISAGIIYFNT